MAVTDKSFFEVRELVRDYGFESYIVGEVTDLLGSSVFAQETEYCPNGRVGWIAVERWRTEFPKDCHLAEGIRYLITRYFDDHDNIRDIHTEITVYGEGIDERNSLHATVLQGTE